VLHLGYAPNDIAFLRNVQDSGIKFKFLFSIYPGIETELLEKYGRSAVTSKEPAHLCCTGTGLRPAQTARSWTARASELLNSRKSC
jgi:hypothetical protein